MTQSSGRPEHNQNKISMNRVAVEVVPELIVKTSLVEGNDYAIYTDYCVANGAGFFICQRGGGQSAKLAYPGCFGHR